MININDIKHDSASKKEIIFTQVPVEEFLDRFRDIVKQEIENSKTAELVDKLLSPSEACKIFQPTISKPTLIKWTAAGSIPLHRIGGRTFYKYSEIIQSLSSLKKYKRAL